MKHDKQSFMESILNSDLFRVINGIGFFSLENGNAVKIQLGQTHNHSGHYDGLLVQVINSKEGLIDQMVFKFQDHLIHNVNDHPNANPKDDLEIIPHVGWEWYINRPTKTSLPRLHKAIFDYVSYFDSKI